MHVFTDYHKEYMYIRLCSLDLICQNKKDNQSKQFFNLPHTVIKLNCSSKASLLECYSVFAGKQLCGGKYSELAFFLTNFSSAW